MQVVQSNLVQVLIGTVTSPPSSSPQLNFLNVLANSQSSQVSVLESTKVLPKKHNPSNKPTWQPYLTPNTLRSANPSAAHARKKLMLLMRTPRRTEPSPSPVQSAFWKPSQELRADKPEKTARANPRKTLSAKPTTPKVVSVPMLNALPCHHAQSKDLSELELKEETTLVLLYDELRF